MPGSEASHALLQDEMIPMENEDTMELGDAGSSHNTSSPALSRDWHEAAFILKIKEQYVLSQVAVDQVLSSTKILMSEVLSEMLDSVRDRVPTDTMQLLEEKVTGTNQSLFSGLSTAYLQQKYFKQHFKLIVSQPL